MKEILISIVIPVYNTEKYIERCLDSVLFQKFENYEIIIVNDGSTDSSEQLIKKVKRNNPDKLIKYIKQENKGLSEARNRGMSEASGKYVVWLDSDDALAEGTLAKLGVLLNKEPDIVICRIASFDENSGSIIPCSYTFTATEILDTNQAISILNKTKGFWYAAWCIIPKREMLLTKNIRFVPGLYHEDELWTPTVIVASQKICFFDECYYLNTSFRKGSIITKKNIKKEFDKMKVCQLLRILKQRIGKDKSCFINRRILIILFTVFTSIETYKDDEKYAELKLSFYSTLKNVYGIFSPVICVLYYVRKLIW